MSWPNEGERVFIITGSGAITGIRWSSQNGKYLARRDFMGVYRTIAEANEVYELIIEICQKRGRS